MVGTLEDRQDRADVITGALAQVLDSGSNREILLATCVQVLGRNALGYSRLAKYVASFWPTITVNDLLMQEVLQIGKSNDMLDWSRDENGVHIWHLTDKGRINYEDSRSWEEGFHRRVELEIKNRAAILGLKVDNARCVTLTRALERAIADGIREDGRIFSGEIGSADSECLYPVELDTQSVLDQLDRKAKDRTIAQFLKGSALAALDETDPFGIELVTNVVTRHLLHAMIARRDITQARSDLGPVQGLRIALDTPILVLLLGTSSEAVCETLRTAVHLGIEVIVAEHSVEELTDSLMRVEARFPEVKQATLSPEDVLELARGRGEGTVVVYAEALLANRYKTWDDFLTEASRAAQVLGGLGVVVRPHGNGDRNQVEQCKAALEKQLAGRRPERGRRSIDWDAETLAMVWRWRRTRNRNVEWPGGCIVTSDRHLTPTMKTLEPDSRWPVAISLAWLSTLLTRWADVPSVSALTRAAAGLVTQEAASMACQYPPEVAIEFAKRLAQFPEEMRDQRAPSWSDVLLKRGNVTAEEAAKIVEDMWLERVSAAYRAAEVRRKNEVESARDELNRIAEERDHLKGQLERTLFVESGDDDAARATGLATQMKNEWGRFNRAKKIHYVTLLHAVLIAVMLVIGFYSSALALALSATWVWARSGEWIESGTGGVGRFFLLGFPDLLSVVVWIWDRFLK